MEPTSTKKVPLRPNPVSSSALLPVPLSSLVNIGVEVSRLGLAPP